jgi:hypothetical protein
MRDAGLTRCTSTPWATWWAATRQRPARRQNTADRQPLRHRAQRRQVRRAAGHLRAHGLRARAAPRRANACRSASRWWPLPKKKASATRPPSWARARSPALQPRLAGPEGRRRHHHAQAMQHAGLCMDDIPKLQARPGATTWALSKCTSSRARCSTSWTCRWASSPPSTAACATWARCRHGQPRRHHAHGPPPRRACGRGRAGAVRRAARRRATAIRWAPSACCRCRAAPSTWCRAAASSALDLRAPTDPQRDALVTDVLAELARICEQRGLRYTLEVTMRPAPRPAPPPWQQRWERAVDAWACRCTACPAAPATTP